MIYFNTDYNLRFSEDGIGLQAQEPHEAPVAHLTILPTVFPRRQFHANENYHTHTLPDALSCCDGQVDPFTRGC
jgi:hypothetical protein